MPRVRLKPTAEEQLAALPQALQEAVDGALLQLYADAHVGVGLRGNLRGRWKLAVGPFRILYRIRDEGRLVIVDAIVFRNNAYPRLGH